jgi:hypothetical protein
MAVYRSVIPVALAVFVGAAAPGSAQVVTYTSVVLADNPVAYYRFSEASGTTAANSAAVSGAINGTYTNGVSLNQPSLAGLTPAPVTAAGFNGANNYVLASGLNGPGANQVNGLNFTLETWIRTTANSPTGTQGFEGNGLIYADVGGVANDYILAVLNNRAAFFVGNPDMTITGTQALNDGAWHHVVATRAVTGGSSALALYVDGALDATGTSSNTLALIGNPDVALGGNLRDGRYFTGLMDEVALYNAALTPARVQAHYLAAVPEPSAGLLTCAAAAGLWAARRRRRARLLGGAFATAGLCMAPPAAAGQVLVNHAAVYASALEGNGGVTVSMIGAGALASGNVYAQTYAFDTGQFLWGQSAAAANPTGQGLLKASATAYGQPGPNPTYGGNADADALWTDIAYTDGPVHPNVIYGHIAVHGLLSSPPGGGSVYTNSLSRVSVDVKSHTVNLPPPFWPILGSSHAQLMNANFAADSWDTYSFQGWVFDGSLTFPLTYDASLGGYGFAVSLRTEAVAKGGLGSADFFNTLDLMGFSLADGTPVPVHFDSGLVLGSVPEPSSAVLSGLGAFSLLCYGRRKRRAACALPGAAPDHRRPATAKLRLERLEDRAVPAFGLGWAFHVGGLVGDSGQGVAVDGGGNVYVTGNFNGANVNFDPLNPTPAPSAYLSSNPAYINQETKDYDPFVAEYTPGGRLLWATSLGSLGSTDGPTSGIADMGIAVQGTSVYVAYSNGDTSALTVAKLDAANGGALVWAASLPGAGYYGGAGVAVGPSTGDLYVTGGNAASQAVVARLDPASGAALWTRTTSGGNAGGNGVAVYDDPASGAESVYVTGGYTGTASFGATPLTSLSGSTDAFVWKLNPDGTTAGATGLGTSGGDDGGSLAGTDQFSVPLGVQVNGLNYNFGERPAAGGSVQRGQAAGIGFWNNRNGQALIKALNGGTGHQLADWLAATLPHMFGASVGGNNLAGQSNAYIAALFQQDFLMKGVKLDAQVLATALSVYATNAALDPTQAAAHYGFTVGGAGLGAVSVNVGSDGDAFGVANNTTMTVMDLLLATDAQAANGVLYGGNATKRKEANDVYSALNEGGGL